MKLRTQSGKWYITNDSGEVIVRNSSTEAWKYIFDNFKKEIKV